MRRTAFVGYAGGRGATARTEIAAGAGEETGLRPLWDGLRFLGTKRFHEGKRQLGFWLGNVGQLFVNREAFDVFACPTCGKVEFFVDGLGEDLRPDERSSGKP